MPDNVMTLQEKRQTITQKVIKDILPPSNDTERIAAYHLMRGLWTTWHVIKPNLTIERERDNRGLWDIWLNSIRQSAVNLRQSFLSKVISTTLGCGEASNLLHIYAERVTSLTRIGLLVYQQESVYNKALLNAKQGCSPELTEFYANCKTWLNDEKLNKYLDDVSTYNQLKKEVIIEAPVRLLLSLSESGFLAVLKLPLWMGGLEQPDTQDLVLIYRDMKDKLDIQWSDGIINELIGYVSTVIHESQEKYETELKRYRLFMPKEDDRKRFIKAFEAGEYVIPT